MAEIEASNIPQTKKLVQTELERCIQQINDDQVHAAAQQITEARCIFFAGAGRSGLALKMGAMRMMHLGLSVYVAGEIVTPAMQQGDLLVVASGSGTTAGALQAAHTARKVDARILLLTTAPKSPLSQQADLLIEIPAASKQQFGERASQQYAGALFEQSVVLVMDILFHHLWNQRGETQQELWKRHANLE